MKERLELQGQPGLHHPVSKQNNKQKEDRHAGTGSHLSVKNDHGKYDQEISFFSTYVYVHTHIHRSVFYAHNILNKY